MTDIIIDSEFNFTDWLLENGAVIASIDNIVYNIQVSDYYLVFVIHDELFSVFQSEQPEKNFEDLTCETFREDNRIDTIIHFLKIPQNQFFAEQLLAHLTY